MTADSYPGAEGDVGQCHDKIGQSTQNGRACRTLNPSGRAGPSDAGSTDEAGGSVSLSRQVTVRMPRPGGPAGPSDWSAQPEAPAALPARINWSPLASRPLHSPAPLPPVDRSWQGGQGGQDGHGRHRVRRSPGMRVAGFVLGIACLGAAFGGGWLLGERWAPDQGASLAVQWQSAVEGLRDWALGL